MRFDHEDHLADLHQNIELSQKVRTIHQTLHPHFPFVSRIAIALYDAKSDLLKSFLFSSAGANPLAHYQAKLSGIASLTEILQKKRPRVINDLSIFNPDKSHHTKRMQKHGYLASYTMPMYERGTFVGFLFFNAQERNCFTEEVLRQLDPYGHLIALTVINDLTVSRTLLATIKTAREMSHLRDDETGAHQDRMSRYARLIARKMAAEYGFTDEYIENVFVFSPLHDIGKMGIPDHVLLKPGRLTEEEFEQMKTHTTKGRQLVDQLLQNFALDAMPNIDILRNIAEFHHEAVDGSGYPNGRKVEDIPIEARIVAVADVFDALTSRRPYKQAWNNAEAFDLLERLSGSKLDQACVSALSNSKEEIETIQRQFQENTIG